MRENIDTAGDQLLRFGGGGADTTITAATATLVLIAILLFFLLPRKYLIAPLLFISIFIPLGQVVVVGGLHFSIFRLVLPFAWVRLVLGRSDKAEFRFTGVDKAVVLWAFSSTVFFVLLWDSVGAFVNRLGFLYNVFGIYFLLRLAIRDREDVNRTIRVLAVICSVIAVFMVFEQETGRNVFSVFGGVSELTPIRDGRLRSQAVFAHAIVAGTVGATLVPIFIGLWWQGGRSKLVAAAGVFSGLVITLTSASSTPLSALIAAVAALCLWPIRRHMRLLRWGVVSCLVGLHLVMKAPVWALIQRVDLVGGSSGWHRYELINATIEHFGDWWLTGTRNPSSWGWFMGDVSNAYMDAAVSGGLLTLILFFGILQQSFRALGNARKDALTDRKFELQVWAFGAALFAAAAAFIGITFFDQSIVIWYAFLAMISAITSVAAEVPAPQSENVPESFPSWVETADLPDRVGWV
jgi:hypothetical protein